MPISSKWLTVLRNIQVIEHGATSFVNSQDAAECEEAGLIEKFGGAYRLTAAGAHELKAQSTE